MLSFFKRRAFRAHVRTEMSYLLGFGLNDTILAAVLLTYPKIWDAVDHDFKQGKTPIESATAALAIAFTHEIEDNVPWTDLERMERYVLNGEGEPQTALEKGASVFLTQVLTQKDLGRIPESLYNYTITEIIGALRGIERSERSARRIVAPLMSTRT